MNDLFVTYELSVKLKNKGFNEPCMKYFYTDKQSHWAPNHRFANRNIYENQYNQPLYQQVIDWLEEKHNIYISSHVSASTMDEFGKIKRVYKILKVSEFKYKIGQSCRQKKAHTLNEAIEESLKLIP